MFSAISERYRTRFGEIIYIFSESSSEDAKFELTVKLLASTSRLEFYKPSIKHYLPEHVKSKFAEVKAPEWEIATFRPTAQWTNASAGRVYQDSRTAING